MLRRPQLIINYFSSGLGATLNVAKPKKGSTVAIFGLGAVGLAVSETLSSVSSEI
jgi:Zn-dependent alcohol dehydrogenase